MMSEGESTVYAVGNQHSIVPFSLSLSQIALLRYGSMKG